MPRVLLVLLFAVVSVFQALTGAASTATAEPIEDGSIRYTGELTQEDRAPVVGAPDLLAVPVLPMQEAISDWSAVEALPTQDATSDGPAVEALPTQDATSDGPAVEVPPKQDAVTTPVSSFGIDCLDGRCWLVGVYPSNLRMLDDPSGILIPSLSGGHADFDQAPNGEGPCDWDNLSDAPATMTIDATATEITVIWITESFMCSDGVDASGRTGLTETWTGTFLDGDRCLIEPVLCAADTGGGDTPGDDAVTDDTSAGGPVTDDTGAADTDAGEAGASAEGAESPAQDTTAPSPAPTDRPQPASWSSPSRLSSLLTLPAAGLSPAQLGVAAALTLILILLIAFPTALLNSAVERAANMRSRPQAAKPVAHLSGWWKAGLGVMIAAVISGFTDPEFGLNAQSLRVVASILIAFTVDVIIGWSVLIWMVRRSNPGVSARFDIKPFTLLIVLGAVILTRMTTFEPGIVFGLVAGVAFSGTIVLARRAPAELMALGYAFTIAVLAWAGYTLVVGIAAQQDAGLVFLKETLASFAVAGAAALPLVLVPLYGLPGYAVFKWRRVAWGVAYFVALFTFFVMLMPMPDSWTTVAMPLRVWVTIYLVYFVTALAAWMIVRLLTPRAIQRVDVRT